MILAQISHSVNQWLGTMIGRHFHRHAFPWLQILHLLIRKRKKVCVSMTHTHRQCAYLCACNCAKTHTSRRSTALKILSKCQLHANGRLLGDLAIVRELDAGGELSSELSAFFQTPPLAAAYHLKGVHASTDARTEMQQDNVASAWEKALQQPAGRPHSLGLPTPPESIHQPCSC